jgi:K+-transporting ATPase KdpF subunit
VPLAKAINRRDAAVRISRLFRPSLCLLYEIPDTLKLWSARAEEREYAYDGPVLHCRHHRVFHCLLVSDAGLRKALGNPAMDYIVAGVAAALLFAYLFYALLKPEKF